MLAPLPQILALLLLHSAPRFLSASASPLLPPELRAEATLDACAVPCPPLNTLGHALAMQLPRRALGQLFC